MASSSLKEIGRLGQKRYGGFFYEEFLKELQGRKGIEVYREMSENDDVIGSILYAIEMLIRQVSWRVQPAGSTPKDEEAAEFIYQCMDDMSDTWTDTISEILSFLTFGWSAHELVYKRRAGKSRDPKLNSKYSDGLIGWQKLPIRAQETLWEWIYDDGDNLLGMSQMPPPKFEIIQIPIEKLMIFRTKSRKGSPEGRSILRNAYRSWYFKRRIQEIEGIGVERDLAGFPVLTAPEGMNIWDDDDPDMAAIRAAADAIVQNVRRDSLEGLSMPSGWKLELLSTGGRRQFDTNAIIERYDTRIAMTVLADFVLLGHQQVGSFALSSDKTELFAMAIGAYLGIICETFNNKAIPALIDLNGEHFNGITDYPALVHGDVEGADIQALASYIKDMTGVGVLIPDDGIEDFVREAAGLPERLDDNPAPRQPGKKPKDVKPGTEAEPDDLGELDDDEEAVKKAKERLGRYD
ncbi:MAG: hypothetical protein PHE09_09305 [Oscillospiraceae bacterium]|nr:hypothetical protein [Oscillospiraceae bacterium]